MKNPSAHLLPALLFLSLTTHAQTTYLKVGEAKEKKPNLAIVDSTVDAAMAAQAALVQKTIESDLEFMGLFNLVPHSAFAKNAEDWVKAGADFRSTSIYKTEGDHVSYEFHFLNTADSKDVFAKRYTGTAGELKILAHTVANDIVQNLTGKKGIFLTKIAFQCDKTGKKEIFTANFDGSDAKQVTKLRSIAMSPAWSPDGTKLAFSVYNRHSDNTKNLDLFEYNFKNASVRLLSNRKGINSGANYSPTANTLAYTMSISGNPEIHLLNLENRESTQLTKSIGFDVDPAFSPDGKSMAFVSSRGGKPMVYTIDIKSPNAAKRLTFAGAYNATPNWTPDGKKIVFAGWLDGHFDIFTITADGAKIDRLTKSEGNNEDPTYSPDGNFVVFSSNRSQGKNIFLMNADGGNVKRLTFGLGNCVSPKWSPFL